MSRCVGFPQFCAKLVVSPQEKLSTINNAIPAIHNYTNIYHLNVSASWQGNAKTIQTYSNVV